RPYSDASGVIRSPGVSLPGTIPAHASPPRAPDDNPTTSSLADTQVRTTRVATAQPATTQSTSSSASSGGSWFGSGMLDRMSRAAGLSSDPQPEAAPAGHKKAAPAPKVTQTAAAPKAKSADPAPKQTATAPAPAAPKAAPTQEANADAGRPASTMMSGAQPT